MKAQRMSTTEEEVKAQRMSTIEEEMEAQRMSWQQQEQRAQDRREWRSFNVKQVSKHIKHRQNSRAAHN